jgi:hypothetical protein
MSGALNSVLGGGGLGSILGGGGLGSILGGGGLGGALGGIVGIAFPPAGIAMAAANLLAPAIGEAVNGAAKQLCQEAGMPKFLQDVIGKVVDEVLGKNRQPADPECERACGNQPGIKDDIQSLVEQMIKGMVDRVKDEVQGGDKCEGGKGGKSGGSSSWLVALARALGEVAGDKAAKMVELGNKLETLGEEGNKLESGEDGKETDAQKANARESVATQSELNGVSKEFQQFMETLNTVVKGIGDGLTSVARK